MEESGGKRGWTEMMSQYPDETMYAEDDEDYSTQDGEEHLLCPNCGTDLGWLGEEVDHEAALKLLEDSQAAWGRKSMDISQD